MNDTTVNSHPLPAILDTQPRWACFRIWCNFEGKQTNAVRATYPEPREWNNLASKPEHRATLEQMQKLARAHRQNFWTDPAASRR